MAEDPPPPSIWARATRATLSVAVVVVAFVFVLPEIASYGDVWDEVTKMTALEVLTLGLVSIWNLITYWFVLVAVLPGLSYSKAALANQASTAVANVTPAGAVFGLGLTFTMYRSWGFSRSEAARASLLSGVWNNFVKLALPILALVLLAVSGDVGLGQVISAGFGLGVIAGFIVLFRMMMESDRVAYRVGTGAANAVTAIRRLFGRGPVEGWGEAVVDFFATTEELLRRRWVGITVATIVSHMSLFVVLLVTLRHVGVTGSDVSWIEALAAFAFIRLISALPITPGGIGLVELGYAAVLSIGVDSATSAQIVAAVLVFRFLTFFLPIPIGALSYLYWRRSVTGERAG